MNCSSSASANGSRSVRYPRGGRGATVVMAASGVEMPGWVMLTFNISHSETAFNLPLAHQQNPLQRAGPVGIFAELHVEHPMFAIFDPPMPAYGLGKVGQVSERA